MLISCQSLLVLVVDSLTKLHLKSILCYYIHSSLQKPFSISQAKSKILKYEYIQIEVKKGEGSKKEVSNYSLQGGTTLKSHVLVVTCNTFQFVEYYQQKSKSHQAWCVYDSWPIKLGGRSHQLRYFPQNTMASSTTQEDGREKLINFRWG